MSDNRGYEMTLRLGCWAFVLFVCVLVSSCQSAPLPASSQGGDVATQGDGSDVSAGEYILGAGDEIDINVWRRQDLTRSVMVSPTGVITIPLAGQIRAQGRTVEEVRQEVTKELRRYYVNPVVDVTLTSARSRRVYVFGEVMAPGPLMLTRSYRVWETVLESGGFNNDANEGAVILIRTENGTPQAEVLTLDIGNIIKGGGGDAGPVVRNGDIVYVPRKFIADVEAFMVRLNTMIQPVIGVERGIILGDDAWKILKSEDNNDGVVIAQ